MKPADIIWSTEHIPHDCVYENEGGMPIRVVKQNGENGCSKCLLVYLSSHFYGRDHFEGSLECTTWTDSLVLAYEKSPLGFLCELGAVQLFYPAGTPRPAWNLIKPGRISSRGRPEQFRYLLKTWIGECDATHKRCTNNNSVLPHRVLDVGDSTHQNLSLYVSSRQFAPYVALSHCWGKSPFLQTKKSNIRDHESSISFQRLPKTFQDAITVTRGIGVRYLWIDSLCIIQDDKFDWETESSKMAAIYNNAYLVLAASQSCSSSEGFLDRKDESFSQTPQLDARNSLKIAKLRNPNGTTSHIYCRQRKEDTLYQHRLKVAEAPLNRRGWVLQENILSRRIVHFTDSEVLWECIECLKCECMEVEDEVQNEDGHTVAGMLRRSQFTRSNADGGNHNLHEQWLYLINRYKGLTLTHDFDRLPALSGLARLWKSRGAGQYLAGLWRDYLPESLLWVVEPQMPRKNWEGYMAPSWSPFSVGYIDDANGTREPGFTFTDEKMTKRSARVMEAKCSPVGNDSMGAVKDGVLALKCRMGTIRVEGGAWLDSPDSVNTPYQGRSPVHPQVWGTVHWDCCAQCFLDQDVSLILLGYYEYIPEADNAMYMVVMPSDTIPGTFKRVGLLLSARSDLHEFVQDADECIVRLV
ncbi:heterokaryon incompatibility [Fusarium longipes]|uniref:Heterokaryon incompatibility n=1 Tax=Fusarium longipes TaxID=694270 RepID=A0A395SR83_9HYPO|nr:heterokaryon incompatibility [Fusarium longipes]